MVTLRSPALPMPVPTAITPVATARTSGPLELLPEFHSELHRLDVVDLIVQQAIVHPVIALRIPAKLSELVEGVLDVGFEVPVVQAGAGREIEGRERRRISCIEARRLQAVRGRTLVEHRGLREALEVSDVECVAGGAIELELGSHGQLCSR